LPTQVFTLNQQVKPTFSCSDDTAIASCVPATGSSCAGSPPTGSPLVNGNLDTKTVGVHSFIVTATDLAGNSKTSCVTYTVIYTFPGFRTPVDNPPVINVVKGGSTVPVKWLLTDAGGTNVTVLSAVQAIGSKAIRCPSASADPDPDNVSPGLAGLRYDGQYIYNWPTLSKWAGSCRQFYVLLADGTTKTANFQFK
jgi:hypothetical protein